MKSPDSSFQSSAQFAQRAAIIVTLAVMTLISAVVLSFGTRTNASAASSNLAPSGLVNADGTINLHNDHAGAVDLNGWQVALDPQRGPILSRADNHLRAGGNANGSGAQAIPLVDGTWSSLNNGVNHAVNAVVVSGGNVYVGGNFDFVCGDATCTIGNTTVNHIAKWNGSSWSSVGNGLSGAVNTIVVSGSNVYVGGFFARACGNLACDTGNTTVNNVAKWNGSSWSALGNGVSDSVNALAVNGSDVFVGGAFTQVCGNSTCNIGNTTVNNIAKWNGSSWSALGNGLINFVNTLAVSGSNLYVGGYFLQVCGNAACNSGNTTVNNLALWNGSTWSSIGNGVNSVVRALVLNGGDVFVGGLFTQACGNVACNSGNTQVNYIARWNGSSWSALGNGLNNAVSALAVNSGNVYVGGYFDGTCSDINCSSTGATIYHVALWDGSTFSLVGNGVNAAVYSLAPDGSNLFAGGNFTQACGNSSCGGNTTVNYIAEFVPTSPYADLSILKTEQVSGGTIAYTLKVTNLGPRDASNVVVTDPLPLGVKGTSVSPTTYCTLASSKVTCRLATLGSGATFNVTIKGYLLTSSSAVRNCASVSSDTPDPDSRNNTSCVQ